MRLACAQRAVSPRRPCSSSVSTSSSSPPSRPCSAASSAAAAAAAAGGENTVVRVCQHKACRRAGSAATLAALTELAPAGVAVERSGCLGACGAGPNVALLPAGLVVRHCATPAHAARLVARQCAGGNTPAAAAAAQALALRVEANAALDRGEAEDATAKYTAALALGAPRGRHKLLANRAAAALAAGRPHDASEDAREALELDPGYATAHVRLADALAALDDHRGARDALLAAKRHDADLAKYSNEFRDALADAERKCAAVAGPCA